MPPTQLFDFSTIDLNQIVIDKKAIQEVNPQRYEMDQLDGIIWYNKEKFHVLGYKDVTEKEFWVRGHIPGRPLMPGVIMVEAAAQLSSVFVKNVYGLPGFIGFSSIDQARFRKPIEPGNRLYLLGFISSFKSRKYTAVVQGVVNGSMAFDCILSGMNV
jgi:3-hydroxyacyl-[acyl-carrier-protein] dehydratase